MSHVTTCDIPRASWQWKCISKLVYTLVQAGFDGFEGVFLVRWISNFGTVNFGTPQHSRNHSNHSFNRLTIVSKVVITFESWKLTSRLLELSKANRFYISEQGPFWETLGLLRNSLSMHTVCSILLLKSFDGSFTSTSMLMTDVGDKICCRQLWDVGDGFCRFCHQHPLIT